MNFKVKLDNPQLQTLTLARRKKTHTCVLEIGEEAPTVGLVIVPGRHGAYDDDGDIKMRTERD
jgi:hypothetical protein